MTCIHAIRSFNRICKTQVQSFRRLASDLGTDKDTLHVVAIGSKGWFKYVPLPHRGQILQQMIALGVTSTVFAIGSTESMAGECEIFYTLLLTIGKDELSSYEQGLKEVTSFFSSVFIEKPLFPDWSEIESHVGDDELLLATKSHYPFWRSFRQSVKDGFIFSNGIECYIDGISQYYDVVKAGLDSHSRLSSDLGELI